MSVSDGNPKKYVKIIAKTSNGYSAVLRGIPDCIAAPTPVRKPGT